MSETDVIAERIRKVLEDRTPILEGYLFGSTARGNPAEHSDVDVAVYVDPTVLPSFDESELISDLMAALQRNDVDLVVLNHASPLLYHRVLRDGMRLLSRDAAATTRREGYALSRYCDYRPQIEKIDRVLRRRIGSGEFGR